MNIDEGTARNTCRVLDILISFYDSDLEKVCVYHIKSVQLIKVNASTVTEKLLQALDELGLDKSRLISILMDSCAVMRGSKCGLESRMKKHCPNLLDIDGDTCHHVNNAAKKFTSALGGKAELLFFDLHIIRISNTLLIKKMLSFKFARLFSFHVICLQLTVPRAGFSRLQFFGAY